MSGAHLVTSNPSIGCWPPDLHSRLPCYVFCTCMLTNKNPNANKLSWVINWGSSLNRNFVFCMKAVFSDWQILNSSMVHSYTNTECTLKGTLNIIFRISPNWYYQIFFIKKLKHTFWFIRSKDWIQTEEINSMHVSIFFFKS